MKILAIEASGPVAGCALIEDDILRAEYSIQDKMKHSRTLVPMMEEIRSRLELDLAEIDAVAVTKGPGSFTGLRIGAATAKGLGLALEKPLIPVPTADCIAWNLYGTDSLVCPLMDARRQQVYTGIYECRESLRVLLPQRAAALTEILDRINALAALLLPICPGRNRAHWRIWPCACTWNRERPVLSARTISVPNICVSPRRNGSGATNAAILFLWKQTRRNKRL